MLEENGLPKLPERLQEVASWLELYPASELSQLEALHMFAAEEGGLPFAWRSYRHNRVVSPHLHQRAAAMMHGYSSSCCPNGMTVLHGLTN